MKFFASARILFQVDFDFFNQRWRCLFIQQHDRMPSIFKIVNFIRKEERMEYNNFDTTIQDIDRRLTRQNVVSVLLIFMFVASFLILYFIFPSKVNLQVSTIRFEIVHTTEQLKQFYEWINLRRPINFTDF